MYLQVRQEVHSLVYIKLIHFLNTNAVSKVLTKMLYCNMKLILTPNLGTLLH